MYKNIGSKIKLLAKILACIGIVLSISGGILMIINAETYYGDYDKVRLWSGIAIIVLGSLFSWLSSWFMYGFGELIETNVEIVKNTAKCSSNNKDISN
jgi:energy-coupling factor transporter transmembrane protein EcfT